MMYPMPFCLLSEKLSVRPMAERSSGLAEDTDSTDCPHSRSRSRTRTPFMISVSLSASKKDFHNSILLFDFYSPRPSSHSVTSSSPTLPGKRTPSVQLPPFASAARFSKLSPKPEEAEVQKV